MSQRKKKVVSTLYKKLKAKKTQTYESTKKKKSKFINSLCKHVS